MLLLTISNNIFCFRYSSLLSLIYYHLQSHLCPCWSQSANLNGLDLTLFVVVFQASFPDAEDLFLRCICLPLAFYWQIWVSSYLVIAVDMHQNKHVSGQFHPATNCIWWLWPYCPWTSFLSDLSHHSFSSSFGFSWNCFGICSSGGWNQLFYSLSCHSWRDHLHDSWSYLLTQLNLIRYSIVTHLVFVFCLSSLSLRSLVCKSHYSLLNLNLEQALVFYFVPIWKTHQTILCFGVSASLGSLTYLLIEQGVSPLCLVFETFNFILLSIDFQILTSYLCHCFCMTLLA